MRGVCADICLQAYLQFSIGDGGHFVPVSRIIVVYIVIISKLSAGRPVQGKGEGFKSIVVGFFVTALGRGKKRIRNYIGTKITGSNGGYFYIIISRSQPVNIDRIQVCITTVYSDHI